MNDDKLTPAKMFKVRSKPAGYTVEHPTKGMVAGPFPLEERGHRDELRALTK